MIPATSPQPVAAGRVPDDRDSRPADGMSAVSKPQRIQLRRTKGWRKPEGAVVVSRPSKWGNPFKVINCGHAWGTFRDDDCGGASLFRSDSENDARTDAVARYRQAVRSADEGYYWSRRFLLITSETIRAELAGKDLACWCPLDQPCHADVLLELANGASA